MCKLCNVYGVTTPEVHCAKKLQRVFLRRLFGSLVVTRGAKLNRKSNTISRWCEGCEEGVRGYPSSCVQLLGRVKAGKGG